MMTTTRLDEVQLQQTGAMTGVPGYRITAGPGHPDDDRAWDAWLGGQRDSGILQLSRWGALKERFGWQRRLVLVRDGPGHVCAGAQLLLRSQYCIKLAYVPRGPVTAWQDERLTNLLLDAVRRDARAAGAAILKLEPGLPDTPAARALLASYGFEPSPQTVQPPSTVVVNLCGTEEEILGRMKAKWRYNVRLAERKGVTVRPLAREELPLFDRLMATTGQRDGFAVHSPAYYAAAFDLLAPDHAVFLLAEYEREPLGVAVVAMTGATACYLWGASSDRERNRMPNHALQWAGMRWARARGATQYDFWGIPDELGRLATALARGDGSGTPVDALPLDLERLPATGLWGVYRFKQGFGGDVVRYVGAWDAALDPTGYALYRQGLGARTWLADVNRRVGDRLSRLKPPAPDSRPPEVPIVQVISDAGEWRRLLEELPEPHVLQSWEWGVLKAQTEWRAERVMLRSGAGAAAFQFLSRTPLPALPLRAYATACAPVHDRLRAQGAGAGLGQSRSGRRDVGPDRSICPAQGRNLCEDRSRRAGRYIRRQARAPRAPAARLACQRRADPVQEHGLYRPYSRRRGTAGGDEEQMALQRKPGRAARGAGAPGWRRRPAGILRVCMRRQASETDS